MKAEELRIGNLVKRRYYFPTAGAFKEITVSAHDIDVCDKSSEDFEPISLTEERLLKFGITHSDGENWWSLPKDNPYQSHHIIQMANGWAWFIEFDSENCRLINGFNYVHELQNLCFVLTEQELKL